MTLVVGDAYRKRWQKVCEIGWRGYAERHGFELIVLDAPLDASARARARSPAWQKCLVLSQGFSSRFDQVVWVDADVVIREDAPPVADDVPLERVGAVNEVAAPTRDAYRAAHEAQVRRWTADGLAFPPGQGREYYAAYGLPPLFEDVVQTGVLVLSPRHHRELLERVYAAYEDRGAFWNDEMRPLSFEILSAGAVQWIDPRFNVHWGRYKALGCPDLARSGRSAALALHPRHPLRRPLEACARRALAEGHFLHFAGCALEMALLADGPR